MSTRMLKSGKVSLRLRPHPDQYENIRLALDIAKAQIGTQFDEVALDALATFFLTHYPMKASDDDTKQ